MSGPSDDFTAASTWQPLRPGVTAGEVPASWAQGRASFGGLVAAIAVRPMLAHVPVDRWLRSLNVTFVAPLASAPAECSTAVLREGRALSSLESRITQEGSVCAIATAAFTADRPTTALIEPPTAPVRATGKVVPYTEGLMPRFLQHFELRWDSTEPVEAGKPDAHILGACRFPNDARDADVCDVLALLDVWPPALMTIVKTFKTGSTVSWTVDFPFRDIKGRTDEFWSYDVRALAAGGGYGQTQAWLWDPSGRAVARSMQLVAVFE